MSNQQTVVIGYGMAGEKFHCYLIDLTPGLTLYGASSRDSETRNRIVAERGIKAYDSMETVLADSAVDLVVLATPNATHADLAVQALDAGKHVVTDKIMCLNLTECDRMIAAAERSGKLLNVFQNRRWDGDFLTVRKLIAEGNLGDVRWLEAAWQRDGPPRSWRGQAEMGGGWLYDLGAHLIDQTLLLIPQTVTSVYCRMHHDFPEHNVASHTMVVIGFENGATAVCDLGSMAYIGKPRFHVYGTNATFIKHGLDPQENAMKAGNIDAAEEPEALYGRLNNGQDEQVIPTVEGRWRSYYENIANVLNNNTEPAVKLSEARRVIAVIDAAKESADLERITQVRI